MEIHVVHDVEGGEQCEADVVVTVQTVREEWGRVTYVEDVPDVCHCGHVYTDAEIREIEERARGEVQAQRAYDREARRVPFGIIP